MRGIFWSSRALSLGQVKARRLHNILMEAIVRHRAWPVPMKPKKEMTHE